MSKIKSMPAWAIRKALYYVAAAVVAILGAFGILSEVQVSQWVDQLDKIIPWVLGVLMPLIAGSRTHAGSDDRATTAEVQALRQAPDAGQIGQAVVAAIRAEEQGEHTTNRSITPTSVADYYRK